MASALPLAHTHIADLAGKYRGRQIISKRPLVSTAGSLLGDGSRPDSTRASSRDLAGTHAVGGHRYTVPPLTILALDALVKGFEVRPGMSGMPPHLAAALAMRLPVSLDVRITAPHVDDESYWRRVCTDGYGWSRTEVALHGNSWKQMCLERILSRMLEAFGVAARPSVPDESARTVTEHAPPGHDEEFCRPPIDGTHPKWAILYPKQPAVRADGKPVRERFCVNAVQDSERDDAILAGGDSGWPHLEELKHAVQANMASYAKTYAWASVDKSEILASSSTAELASPSTDAAAAVASSAGGTSPARTGTAGNGKRGGAAGGKGDAGAAKPKLPPPLPFTVEAEQRRLAEIATRQREEDAFDAQCNGSHLREYMPPEAMEHWKKSNSWPTQRNPSVLVVRYQQLMDLLDTIAAAADYVFNLRVEQLPSHLDMQLVFSRLPNLTALHLTYSMRHLGMRYDRGLFGMRVKDARLLAECLRNTDTLTSLSLPSNMIDDHLLVELMVGLLDNNTIIHLDLAHNNITSAGVEVLVQLLKKGPSTLATLNLSDNKLDAKAGRHIGRALRKNDSLTELNVRLNDFGDDGGRQLLEGVKSNNTLAVLNLSSNRLGSASAALLAQVLAAPETALTVIELTGNKLDEADADILNRALQANNTVTSLDLRGNASIAENR